MVGALWTGISGLGGSQTGLDNESNNIANVNTIGFKASRVSFADQMYQDKIGKGVTSFDVEKMYTQGNLKNTGVSYDMALSGDGFFQVKNGADTYYTRAGNFRMGEGGTLEDVAQNKVQGWAIQPITDKDRIATDPNAEFFTNDFTKLLGNKVIRDTSSIETIVAKATDYTTTATTDNQTVFTGAGYKSASTKISDVEALITEYNAALSVYAEADPKPTSSTSSSQKSLLNFPLTGAELAEGDEVYAYIDGQKYSVPWNTDNATTMKDFADFLSDAGGFTAYLTDDTSSPFNVDPEANPSLGFVVVEGLIPGKQFRVTEFGWTNADNDNQASKGDVVTIAPAVLGTGMGHINSIRDAMAEAVSGKQMDVYTPSELAFSNTAADNQYTYQIEIYDNKTKETVKVPATPLPLLNSYTNDSAGITAMVNEINNDAELNKYVTAYNLNGNLVVKTQDHNNEVEFTGELVTSIPIGEVQTVKINGTASGTTVNFMGHNVPVAANDTAAQVAGKIDGADTDIITAWNAENPTRKLATVEQIAAATEVHNVSYQALADTESITIGGLTLTATGGPVTAAAIATALNAVADGATPADAGNLVWTGALTGWSTNAAGTQFTSSTPNTNVADLAISSSPTTVLPTLGAVVQGSAGDEIKLTYADTEGNVSSVMTSTDNGITFGNSTETETGRAIGVQIKNPNMSNREGAGAEFLQIKTMINQTASKDELQLRLDTLGLTDSAFGDFEVDNTGLVTMTQDGARFAIGQVAIARFTDNRGLEPIGDNLVMETTRSGSALFNTNNDKMAEIKGGTLELSTADLSESLVNLMVFQRAFEANAKSITTADQILTTLIQLKR